MDFLKIRCAHWDVLGDPTLLKVDFRQRVIRRIPSGTAQKREASDNVKREDPAHAR